jgi:hypothetical protein
LVELSQVSEEPATECVLHVLVVIVHVQVIVVSCYDCYKSENTEREEESVGVPTWIGIDIFDVVNDHFDKID